MNPMNASPNATPSIPWYRERWPWLLMAGPAAVVVAGGVTVWLAIASNDGLVADDYYKQGLAVNQRLQRDQRASEQGMSATLMRSGQQLRVLITAREAWPAPPQLVIKLSHPTRGGRDQRVTLRAEGGGLYIGTLAPGLAGRRLAILEDPAGEWRLQGEWLTDEGQAIVLQPRQNRAPGGVE